jgi:hypothetical protein
MKLVSRVLLVGILFLFSCKESSSKKEIISIATDEFPKLKLDSTRTDTSQVGQLLMKKLVESSSDSIKIIIECYNNAVLTDIKQTAELIKKNISSYHGKADIVIYNKCLLDLKLTKLDNLSLNSITLKINQEGKPTLNGSTINIDAFCKEYKGKPITITLTGDSGLPLEKIIPIWERLKKEKFKVLIKVSY